MCPEIYACILGGSGKNTVVPFSLSRKIDVADKVKHSKRSKQSVKNKEEATVCWDQVWQKTTRAMLLLLFVVSG